MASNSSSLLECATVSCTTVWELAACKKLWIHLSAVREEIQAQYTQVESTLTAGQKKLYARFFAQNAQDIDVATHEKKLLALHVSITRTNYEQARAALKLPAISPPTFAPVIFDSLIVATYQKRFDVRREALHMADTKMTSAQIEAQRKIRTLGRCFFANSPIVPSVPSLASETTVMNALKAEDKEPTFFLYNQQFANLVGRNGRGMVPGVAFDIRRISQLGVEFDALPVRTTEHSSKSVDKARGPPPSGETTNEAKSEWTRAFKRIGHNQGPPGGFPDMNAAKRCRDSGKTRLLAIHDLIQRDLFTPAAGWKDEYDPSEDEDGGD